MKFKITLLYFFITLSVSLFGAPSGNVFHIPYNQETGIPDRMRDPYVEIDPAGTFTVYQGFFKNFGANGDQNGGTLYYRNATTAGTWQSTALGFHADEGANQFWKATIDLGSGGLNAGSNDIIEYYILVTFSGGSPSNTYIYGGDLDPGIGNQLFTETESVAQAAPYSIRNRPAWIFHANNRVTIGDDVQFWAKVGYIGSDESLSSRYADTGYLYYTTDGSTPSGSLGVGSGTTTAVSFIYQYPENNEEQNPGITGNKGMWWRATVADLLDVPLGTTIKYKIGFLHTDNNEEKFADHNAAVEDDTFEFSNGTLGDPVLTINGLNANYTTSKLFVDEIANDLVPLSIVFEPGKANLTAVEVYTNLNRRDLANEDANSDGYEDGIVPVSGDLVTAGSETHYYKAYTMTSAGAGQYTLALNAEKTGAYRLTARFKVSDTIAENDFDANNWIYYTRDGRRDHAITVSPKDAFDINLYEINVFNIEATGDTFAQRSTFEDLHNASGATHNANNRWDLEYLKDNLGSNYLWFQPIHPNGIDGREPNDGWGGIGAPYDPGSPYAVKNFFAVNELMSVDYDSNDDLATNRARAMTAFQNFAAAADAKQIGIMLDAPFNHTAFDVELAQIGVDLLQPDGQTWSPFDEIRDRDARFFSKENDYCSRATGAFDIAAAPDRGDFGKWNDVKDVFFGRYSALVCQNPSDNANHLNESDIFDTTDSTWTSNDFIQGGQNKNVTRQVWKYFAEYALFWLEQTGYPAGTAHNQANRYLGIDGLRCDFGQGLPPQAWEYMINVARERKWNFVMMSESLDGGAVTYRSNRHFDILNENIVFPFQAATTYTDYRNIYEDRRNAYGQGLVLSNNMSHDEESYNDPWEALIRYSVGATVDGVPLIFPGQELGISKTFGYSQYELNFGKQIAHFKSWNSMQPIWNDFDFGNDQLFPVYAGMNQARLSSPALRSQNRYFLDADGFNSKIYAVAKYEEANASPAAKDVILAFSNLDRNNDQQDNFKIPSGLATLLGLDDGRTYNSKNIAAYTAQVATRRDDWLWGSGISGTDLKSGGFTVIMKKVPTTADNPVTTEVNEAAEAWATAPFEAQYLKLYDITAPTATPDQPAGPNVYAYAIGDSATFDWSDVGADSGGVTPHYEVTVTVNGGSPTTTIATDSAYQYTGLEGDEVSVSVKAVNPDFTSNAGPTSSASQTIQLLSLTGDEDGDGANNADEDAAGTNPLDNSSKFVIDSQTMETDGDVTITWNPIAGKTYKVQTRIDLITGNWADGVNGTGLTSGTWTDPNPSEDTKFYRIVVE